MTSRRHPSIHVFTRHVIDLADLGDEKLTLEGAFEPGEIDFSGDDLRQVERLDWSGSLERSGPEIRLTGELATRLDQACVRCLEPIRDRIEKGFDLFFRQRDSLVYEENAEIELDEGDTRTAFVHGTELGLADIIREQVLLALPMKPLCTPDCRGLCPSCGTNLNRSTCDCPRTASHPAFEQLLDLKKRLEDRSS